MNAEESLLLWPIRPRLEAGEILSSWLARVARANGIAPTNFCFYLWPKEQIWTRDIDWLVPPILRRQLQLQAGASPAVVSSSGLPGLEGKVFREHKHNVRTAWILPIGVYHRDRRSNGLQYCAACLAEDGEPYYRRDWRLGFVTCCPRHALVLRNSCPMCERPVVPHRVSLSRESLKFCYRCGYDLSRADAPAAYPDMIAFQEHLEQVAADGYVSIRNARNLDGPGYFTILRQMARLLASSPIAKLLREAAAEQLGREIQLSQPDARSVSVEELSPADRHEIMGAVAELMHPWPTKFVSVCARSNLRSSAILRDMSQVPFAMHQPVSQTAFRGSYATNEKEVRAAQAWLARQGKDNSKRAAKRFISTDAQHFREVRASLNYLDDRTCPLRGE